MAVENPEQRRLQEAREQQVAWRKWGPYLSERQWGTVREDHSSGGDAWNSFSHDQARSRIYQWGEDGIAGFSDDQLTLCFAVALWNGRDPILKERLFGLTNSEGNHGEDVKEYYFYLDATPTHSYNRMLYKYPQAAFPYSQLVQENARRGKNDLEYELLDTGVFATDRYFDVEVEFAKDTPEEILVRITVTNRGPDSAEIDVLPHLWYRNTWWRDPAEPRPSIEAIAGPAGTSVAVAHHPALGDRHLLFDGAPELLFTDNETNLRRFGQPNGPRYAKDGINDFIVHGQSDAVNPEKHGTKAAGRYHLTLGPGESKSIRLWLAQGAYGATPFARFDEVMKTRTTEADTFYAFLSSPAMPDDHALIVRQGFAGLLWSKQAYVYDGLLWLNDRGVDPERNDPRPVRNKEWSHMQATDIISMPDKWEYPWFAAWDLAFQAIEFAFIDPDFAVSQLELMLRSRYLHPTGQIPAYEWNFGDVNPPVHAWATLFTYRLLRRRIGDTEALGFLRRVFHKLVINFTWWTNKKDRDGRNLFEGGFLGLDNIGVFDRSSPLPGGGYLEQADGTAWMALFSQNMLEMAIDLAIQDPIYEEMAIKFYQHAVEIAAAMDRPGDAGGDMWDDADGFFYDVLRFPDGRSARLKVRSMVGLLPLAAATVYPADALVTLPQFSAAARAYSRERQELFERVNAPGKTGVDGRYMLSVVSEQKLRRVLARMLDPNEFLSDYGLRALSRYHHDHPYVFQIGSTAAEVRYVPADSDSGMFGGNSNWRGPVWVPVNVLLIRALLHQYSYYGNDFKVECPTGSGQQMTLFEVAREIARRLGSIFMRDKNGNRPVYGATETFQKNPHWRDLLLFYEYFHGDNGAGVGASHQTGWTSLVSCLVAMFDAITPEQSLSDLGAIFDRLSVDVAKPAPKKGSKPVPAA
jgi:hypothetical protein